MFRYEFLNKSWLDKCKQYLLELFKDIEGKIVVDYAFGRGNWSLAFIAAGAKKVYAIDASIDNCKKLESYCNSNSIENIEVIHGNILNEELQIQADILWVYGVLHHIQEVDLFLQRSKSLMTIDGSAYFYYYNKGSLRNIIVSICRDLYTFEGEEEFSQYQWVFARTIKNRASDDLVAPYIDWKTLPELNDCLSMNGFGVTRGPDKDFDEFMNMRKNQEFYPHQLLCDLTQENTCSLVEPDMPFKDEITTLNRVLREILFQPIFNNDRRNLCIGLYNTHLSHVKDGLIETALIENFIYGLRAILKLDDSQTDAMSAEIKQYKELTLASMQDIDRDDFKSHLGENLFTNFLCENRLRM